MIGEYIKSGDFKGEKHVPVLEMPEKVEQGEAFEVKVSVGKEIAHPNTPEHYIGWIKLFFLPENGKMMVELADFMFEEHNGIKTEPTGSVSLKLEKSGTLYAMSYCNLHGLWESKKDIVVE